MRNGAGSMMAMVALALVAACASTSAEQPDAAPTQTIDAAAFQWPGDANTCAMQPCSILPQCGCSEKSACDVDADKGTVCRDVNLPGIETSTCVTSGDCAAGYTCQGRDKASATCKKFCTTDSACGTPRGRCAIDVSAGTAVPNVCSSNCDPTSTTSGPCPGTFKCGLLTVSTDGVTRQLATCTPAGTLTQGADCKVGTTGSDALCAKGYRCGTTGGGIFQCRRVCKRDAPNCPTDMTCIGISTGFIIDVEYGVCN